MKIKSFKTETFRCSTCHKWYRTLIDESNDWKGLPCGHGATTGNEKGRPFGPKSKAWGNICKFFKVNPNTGEVLPASFLWDEPNWLLEHWFNVEDLPDEESEGNE